MFRARGSSVSSRHSSKSIPPPPSRPPPPVPQLPALYALQPQTDAALKTKKDHVSRPLPKTRLFKPRSSSAPGQQACLSPIKEGWSGSHLPVPTLPELPQMPELSDCFMAPITPRPLPPLPARKLSTPVTSSSVPQPAPATSTSGHHPVPAARSASASAPPMFHSELSAPPSTHLPNILSLSFLPLHTHH